MRCIGSGRASAAQSQTAVVARVGRPGTGFGAADARCAVGHAEVVACICGATQASDSA